MISGGKLKINLGPLAESSLSSALIVINCCKRKALSEQTAPSLGTSHADSILRQLLNIKNCEIA